MKLIQIQMGDNVAVALAPVEAGEQVSVGGRTLTAAESIPQGHKLALVPLKPGDLVYKYGCAIGRVTTPVPAGGWVHTHNMTTNLSARTHFSYRPTVQALESEEPEQFLGYLRPDGRAATRNEIWILPTVGCVNEIASQLAADNQDLVGGSVEGLYAFPHPYGCSQTGADHANTRAILAGLARHPNAAAVLVVGLGCENLQCSQLMEDLGAEAAERVKFLVCQQVEDELAAGRALLEECAAYAAQFQRQPVPVSKLVVGLKCGGSDGLSGITANPVVGRFSDLLVARGGSTILTEVPEMFGAEELLLGRCADEEVFRQAAEMLQGFRDYFVSHGENVYENPSPGNKTGGITTLEDKSCGCVQKGGTAPIVGVVPYGGQVVRPGLNLLWGPGNDLVSTTALSAAGAHLILFTTGRGTPFGSPVPTLKIASNRTLAARKPGWIDFDAGVVAEGEGIGQTARHLFHLVLRTAGGSCTKSEAAGYRGLAIFKDGVTL
ncbi:UxaA family hydrolase [uncultured Flavonifractor sp.]|uniref:UxaA family hydrolase n=1 Tax=uncultured Flavonifractor sp. TaxID=1193534 RepID=UPI002620C67B|nr:altronate dehydratase family protein [uncultured Flavonifractor sp.]